MKFNEMASSLLALALFAAPVMAQDNPDVTQPAAEQPAAPAPEAAPAAEAAPQIPQEVMDLIGDSRPLSELSTEELVSRAKQSRQYAKMRGLPSETRGRLQGIFQAARAEIANREAASQAAKSAKQAPAQPAVTKQPAETAPAPAQPAEAPAPAAAEIPQEVQALLSDGRPASDLANDELNARAKQARKFAKMKSLPQDMRDQLAGLAEAAHTEFMARQEQAAKANQPANTAAPVAEPPPAAEQAPVAEQPPAAEQPAQAAAPGPAAGELPADVTNLLADTRPLTEMTPEELTGRLKSARQLSKSENLPDATRAQLAEIAKAARTELMTRDQNAVSKTPNAPAAPAATGDAAVPPPLPAVIEVAPTAPLPPPPPKVMEVPATPPAAEAAAAAPVAVDKAQTQKLDGNVGTPEAEAKAKAFLDDPQPADKLSDADLRKRLDGMRELMASNQLSRNTERALRKKLKAERDVLRNRVAVAETAPPRAATGQPGSIPPPPSKARPPRTEKNDINVSVEIVLNDRRPSDDLEDYELRRRLEVYRQASYDQRYEWQQRSYWRAVMERDQYQLQQRLMRERRLREAELRAQYNAGQDDIMLDDSRYQEYGGMDDVYAAEVDDGELQDVLIAPPRKKITRRYTVQEVEASPDLRAALPRIEIDTVHFGFNEAFVRAEEVSNLDRLGAIIERILTAHPREVFLIEGHTDAVGSDAANLALSRQRAEAIKKALTTYYVIPDRNLKTVGYGERYLKIPTAEAEQENRRVSVSRATALIGQAEE